MIRRFGPASVRLRPHSAPPLAAARRYRRLSPRLHAVTVRHLRLRRMSAPTIDISTEPSLAADHVARAARGGHLRLRTGILFPLVLFILAFLQNLGAVHVTPFHPDESRWINRAHFIEDVLDPFGPNWDDYYTNRGQPPMGSYVIGLGLLLQGRDLNTNLIWDFSYDNRWNRLIGAMSDEGDLDAARRTSAFLGAISVVIAYLVISRLSNPVGGFLGGAFLAFHPLQIYIGSQALSDQLLAVCLGLTFLAGYRFAQRPDWPRAITLGVILGLGGATKLSPLLLSLPMAGVGAIWLAWTCRMRLFSLRSDILRSPGFKLLVQPLIAFAAFVAVSPYLWQDPIRRTYYLFEFRRIEMIGQAENWPDVGVANPFDAMARIGNRLNELNSTTARVQEWIQAQSGFDWPIMRFDLLLVAIGGLLLIRQVVREGIFSPVGLTSVLIGAEFGAVVLGMASDFYRYYMPIVLVDAIFVGVLFGALFDSPARHWLVRLIALVPGIDLVHAPAGHVGAPSKATLPPTPVRARPERRGRLRERTRQLNPLSLLNR